MSLRICILARENVLHWTSHYIAAFRQCAEVITIGPPLDHSHLARMGWQDAAIYCTPNDIRTEAVEIEALLALLPQGWQPDLLITIQSGAPAYSGIARLAIPTVYLSVDTWHDHEEFHYVREYDFVFCAQKVFPSYFKANGAPHVAWLPLACNPDCHHPVAIEKDLDIVFVGATTFVVNEERMQRLQRLAAIFKAGQQGGLGGDLYCQTMCRAQIAFNSAIARDLNMRVFEALAMGCPLLTNRDAVINGLFDLFEEEAHLVTYTDADLIVQAQNLLDRPALRSRLSEEGRALVLDQHTYTHRAKRLIAHVKEAAPQWGSPPPALLRDNRLASWIPCGARRILDIGLGLGVSKVALRRRGVDWLGGVCAEDPATHPRRRSYDALFSASALPEKDLDCDTILWTCPFSGGNPVAAVFKRARAWLKAGGSLVLSCEEAALRQSGLGTDAACWRDWSYAQGFHLLALQPPGAEARRWIGSFRRYTRSLHEISTEIYTRFPGGGEKPPLS